MVERAFDHRLGTGLAVLFEQVLLQAAGVDADAHGAAVVLGRLDDLAHALAPPMLPGLIRRQAAPASAASMRAPVVEVDVGHDRHLEALTICLSAAVDSSSGQDTRMMSTPASSQRRIWAMVALASAVSVLVMVWTVIGDRRRRRRRRP